MERNVETFMLMLKHNIEHCLDTLTSFKEAINKDLMSMDYTIKWSAEDVVIASVQWRELTALSTAIEGNYLDADLPIDREEVTGWLHEEISKFDRALRSLSINNSTGMYHNADSFYDLKAKTKLIRTYESFIYTLKDNDETVSNA